jgi:hypothetical protein
MALSLAGRKPASRPIGLGRREKSTLAGKGMA